MDKKKQNEIEGFLEIPDLQAAEAYLLTDLHKDVKGYFENNHCTIRSDSNIHLAHYTGIETLFSMLNNYSEDKKEDPAFYLRLYDAISTNDPTEGNYLRDEIVRENVWIKDAARITDAFVCSFVSGRTKIGDKLTYWQSYGQDGLGCSIKISKLPKDGSMVRPVLYGKTKAKKIKNYFKNYFELGGQLHKKLDTEGKNRFATAFWKEFDELQFLYKHDAYKNEKEYRYVKVVDPMDEKIKIMYDFKKEGPYLRRYILAEEFKVTGILSSGSRVVIGPRVPHHESLLRQLENLKKKAGLHGPLFTRSDIPYRKVW